VFTSQTADTLRTVRAPTGKNAKLHASPTAHTSFALPAGRWNQNDGYNSGNKADGSYSRNVTLKSGTHCSLEFLGFGQARKTRPGVGFNITAQGRTGELRWFLGHSSSAGRPATMAVAYAPLSAGIASPAERWAAFEMTLQAFGDAGAKHECDRLRRKISLRRPITSAHVVREQLGLRLRKVIAPFGWAPRFTNSASGRPRSSRIT
jgi:hypothetical protein